MPVMNSKYQQTRQEQLAIFSEKLAALELEQHNNARELFTNKTNLLNTIMRQIYPATVVIKLACGRVGMGFFRHDQWLVSNAHIIKQKNELDDGIILSTFDGQAADLLSIQAYHRPYALTKSPDLVVIKTKNQHASIPVNDFSIDPTYAESYHFYIDQEFNLHYLDLISDPGVVPMLFRCQDGSTPQPGCSGSPILSARITLGKNPTWQFAITAALYARCNASTGLQSQKLVCGIPVAQEFEQIRKTLITLDSAEHYHNQALCWDTLGDKHHMELAKAKSNIELQLASADILKFELGQSSLDLRLPEGIEQLDGGGFFKLEQSHLKRLKSLSNEEIKLSFFDFIEQIRQQQEISIKVITESTLLYNEYWRLDCKPGSQGKYWLLQLQDNTDKGVKVPGTNKSASSIFAQVKIPQTIEFINGQPFADDLLASYKLVEQGMAQPSIVVEGIENHKLELYMLTKKCQATQLKDGSRLFDAVSKNCLNGFPEIKQFAANTQLVNCVNQKGNTPLMVLLNDHNLLDDPARLAKAISLSRYSLWNQTNAAGKTAAQILNDHPDKDEIKNKINRIQA